MGYMNEIIRLDEIEDRLAAIIGDLAIDQGSPSITGITDLTFRMISDLTDDHFGWIGYWYFELDRGKKYVEGSVTLHGKPIKLKTLNDLWKVLNSK